MGCPNDVLLSYITEFIYFPDEVEADLNHLLGTSKDVQKRSAALFLLRMKESKRLSQAAIDEIVSEWDTLFSHTVHTLTATVRSKLATAGIDYQEIEGLPETFVNITSPFEGLETRFKQEKYYRDFLGLVVSINDWDIIIIL